MGKSPNDKLRDIHHCPACGVRYSETIRCKKVSKHHVLPIRFFGETGLIQFLCAKCHEEIELEIPAKFPRAIAWYFAKVLEFVDRKQKERGG